MIHERVSKMDLFPHPVLVRTYSYLYNKVKVYYPQIEGQISPSVQHSVNQQIIQQNFDLMQMQNPSPQTEMLGEFAVKTNEKNILSIGFSNYAYTPQAAHGMTYIKSLTWDLSSGKTYSLKELFKPGGNYVEILNRHIRAQINRLQITLLEPFKSIRPDQDFYIADKALVIYFQLYEITPYVFGFPMFPISLFDLQNIIDENGPLARLAIYGL
jgi:hypothetical protein